MDATLRCNGFFCYTKQGIKMKWKHSSDGTLRKSMFIFVLILILIIICDGRLVKLNWRFFTLYFAYFVNFNCIAKLLNWRVVVVLVMPNSCVASGCRSGYPGNDYTGRFMMKCMDPSRLQRWFWSKKSFEIMSTPFHWWRLLHWENRYKQESCQVPRKV